MSSFFLGALINSTILNAHPQHSPQHHDDQYPHQDTEDIIRDVVIDEIRRRYPAADAVGEALERSGHDHSHRHRRVVHSHGDFGIEAINRNTLRVFHADYGWTAGFHYLCLNDQCYPAQKQGGFYVYDFPARLGQRYTIMIKVQDDHTPGGQYIASKEVVY
ncbi:family 31 carbohydrate-binding protein [Marinibactrum halimedae]|nr:family 31 carbohydrate-binding protein [Marinibactrum halimedae]MCD9461181.1 family 31 carbohydrate-binding protein [Marinibactrum halimedae]